MSDTKLGGLGQRSLSPDTLHQLRFHVHALQRHQERLARDVRVALGSTLRAGRNVLRRPKAKYAIGTAPSELMRVTATPHFTLDPWDLTRGSPRKIDQGDEVLQHALDDACDDDQ